MFSGMQQAADHSVDNIIIDNHFLGKTNETYERYIFNTRKQKAHETVDDYIAALCILASTCNFCDCIKDSLLRDRIVIGIKDSSTRKRLLQEVGLNLETCIAMCRAADATSPSHPVKTVTWAEDRSAVQAGSVSSEDQRPGKKQDLSISSSHCGPMASPDEVEMSEVNFNPALHWTAEHQSSGFPWIRTEHYFSQKLEPALLGSSTPDRCDADNRSNTDGDKEVDNHGNRKTTTNKFDDSDAGDKTRKRKSIQHVCDVCRKSFPTPGNLKRHKLIHSGVRSFVCDVCRKGFTQAGSLTKHKRVHTGERPYKCPHCDSDFKESGQLQSHIKSVHEGARPHACDVCGASFSQTSQLTVHRRIHTGEKPHVCPDCGKGFAQSGNLQQHRLTHTGEKPHVCSDCGKGFTNSSNLAKHRLIHSEKTAHRCPHCPAAFMLSQDLKGHVHTIHQ